MQHLLPSDRTNRLVLYRCSTCDKSFAVKSTLDAHIRSHSGSKNYQCPVCKAFFASKGSYGIHMRIHTGLKPLPCPYCPAKFRTSGHRRAHILGHFKTSGESGGNPQLLADVTGDQQEEEEEACEQQELTTGVADTNLCSTPDEEASATSGTHVLANLEPIGNGDGTMSFILQMPTASGVQNISLSSTEASNLLNIQHLTQWFTSSEDTDPKTCSENDPNPANDTEEDAGVNSISVNPNIVMAQVVDDIEENDDVAECDEMDTCDVVVAGDGGTTESHFSLKISNSSGPQGVFNTDTSHAMTTSRRTFSDRPNGSKGVKGATVLLGDSTTGGYGCSLCNSCFLTLHHFQEHLLLEHDLSIKLPTLDSCNKPPQTDAGLVVGGIYKSGGSRNSSANSSPHTRVPSSPNSIAENCNHSLVIAADKVTGLVQEMNPFECEVCSARFPTLELGQQHVLTHTQGVLAIKETYSTKNNISVIKTLPSLRNGRHNEALLRQVCDASVYDRGHVRENSLLTAELDLQASTSSGLSQPSSFSSHHSHFPNQMSTRCLFCYQYYSTRLDLSNHVTSNHLNLVEENNDLVQKMGLVLRWKDLEVGNTGDASLEEQPN